MTLTRTTPLKRTGIKRKATKPKRRKAECDVRGCRRVGPYLPDPWITVYDVPSSFPDSKCPRDRRLCMYHADERTAWPRFSWFIRQRDEDCTAGGILPGRCLGPLQAAHIIGRKATPTKYDPRNVHALCKAHHVLVDSAPGHEAHKYIWAMDLLGAHTLAEVSNLAADIGSVKRRDAVTAALATYPPKPDTDGAA